jgi:hypothetical protein
MLPMRCTTCALVMLVMVLGCKNQSTGPMTNPFALTPDRVPPPTTRVLAPGTAQPYYPGDPMPGAVAAPPAGTAGAPAFTTPPATYGPATPLPGSTTPLTTPPGGWSTPVYAPQSSTSSGNSTLAASGDAVSVPSDQQGLRFATASDPASGAWAITPTPQDQPAMQALAAATPPTMRMPIQSMLPLSADQASGATPSQLRAREVTPAEYRSSVTGTSGVRTASAASTSDGFRPQGSGRASSTSGSVNDPAFRPPSIYGDVAAPGSGAGDSNEEASHYGAGQDFASLRGQLEYWPTTGEWSLRYLPTGAPADANGGRVMIDNPQVLGNLPPGELVTVRGQLYGKSNDTGGTTPTYRVSAVQRQRL